MPKQSTASVAVPFDQLSDTAFIRQADLLASVFPVSRVTLWRRIKDGKFPKPVQLDGLQTNFWRVGDVRQWLAQQPKAAA
jgi:predicted DNA-binding transcriptional regulator AlpA